MKHGVIELHDYFRLVTTYLLHGTSSDTGDTAIVTTEFLDLLACHQVSHYELPSTGNDGKWLKGGGVRGTVQLDCLLDQCVCYPSIVNL